MDIKDYSWLALCMASESNQPHEWPFIGWLVRNRKEDSRYPDNYKDVVLQPAQFSWFNSLRTWPKPDNEEQLFLWCMTGGPSGNLRRLQAQYLEAKSCALSVSQLPRWAAPFNKKVQLMYSPVSMVPKWKEPWWWVEEVVRGFTPHSLDSRRWVFGERR